VPFFLPTKPAHKIAHVTHQLTKLSSSGGAAEKRGVREENAYLLLCEDRRLVWYLRISCPNSSHEWVYLWASQPMYSAGLSQTDVRSPVCRLKPLGAR
jgi:hypothetical protein